MRHEEIMDAARTQQLVMVVASEVEYPAYIVTEQVYTFCKLRDGGAVVWSWRGLHSNFTEASEGVDPADRLYLAAVMLDDGEGPRWEPMIVRKRCVKEMPAWVTKIGAITT